VSVTSEALSRTPIHGRHVELGGKMVPFAGWEMPIQYEGVIAEHRQVRKSAGLFDVSHMGQVYVTGPRAKADLQRILSNDIGALADGDAQYTLLTNDRGGIDDDLIAYRFDDDCYLLVVNAANAAADVAIITGAVSDDTSVRDVSAQHAMFALQGPLALDALAETCDVDVRELAPFHFAEHQIDGVPVTVATTGYTGERGCEILVPPGDAPAIWDRLLSDERVAPAGLAARDTLRLEVCYPLHGNDIDAETTAVEAGLGWVCHWDEPFVGREALLAQREAGAARKLVALAATERGIPRAGCPVLQDGREVGTVTSGTMSPSLGFGIALAYVQTDLAQPGTDLTIDVRGRQVRAEVRTKPLYRREETL
jgi:aminomethyltransferase